MQVLATGPRNARIVLVGEAPGKDEDLLGKPFVGSSGQELKRMIVQAGFSFEECFVTNVFSHRPASNNVELFFGSKKEGVPGMPELRKGKYLLPQHLPELQRLWAEIQAVRPNVVIALGATAAWALLGSGRIGAVRGFAAHSTTVPGVKVLPTFHPAAVLRAWELRPIVVADLMKALRHAGSPELVRPERQIWLDPSLEDMEKFYVEHIVNSKLLGFDIETKGGQITCIGFAPSPTLALVVPFLDRRTRDWSYWSDIRMELQAWSFVRRVLNTPVPKVGQNGLYDIQYLWRTVGIPVRNYLHDTMLLHHSMQPELEKSLGFLGSIYTEEAGWKTMRTESEKELEKPNE